MPLITPIPPPWDGSSPLWNGLGISRALRAGSLGLAFARDDGLFFTCARHVVGDGAAGGPLGLWTASAGDAGAWEATASIEVVAPSADEADTFGHLDLALVTLHGLDASNDFFGLRLNPTVVGLDVGATLRYRGCRRGWVNATYYGPYTDALGDAFGSLDLAGLDTTAMGVIGLDPNGYDPSVYEGDSGAALWGKLPNGTGACLGGLVGVSSVAPRGLILRFAEAFNRISMPAYKIKGAP